MFLRSLGHRRGEKATAARRNRPFPSRACDTASGPLTRRDDIGHTAALCEEGAVFDVWEEFLGKVLHVEQAEPDDCRFRVVAHPEAVDEAGGDGDDVLERTAQRHPFDVVDEGDPEVVRLEELPEDLAVLLGTVPDRRLAEVAGRDCGWGAFWMVGK